MAAPSDFPKLICELFKIDSLTQNQKDAIEALTQGKDVFVGTRTGSGKSLTYECIPVIEPGAITIVIAPLVNIMTEQCRKLQNIDLKATYIGKDQAENEAIENAQFDFVFGSPESVLGNSKWREVWKSPCYQDKLRYIVVDEAHTVLLWGEQSNKEEPFREWFGKIGELRSLCPAAQMIALTATSGPSQRRRIMKSLCFRISSKIITDSPDRANIKITSVCIPNNDNLDIIFSWLVHSLKSLKEKMPRHVIFCETIVNTSKIYSFFVKHFGNECKFINMFHSKTNEKIKEFIRNDMSEVSGTIRLLVCTNSAGMGVNFSALYNVVHYGLPREMDTFVQQMGRCGRDGQFSHELILYKAHKGHLKNVESDLVQLAKDTTVCRRLTLCNSYLLKKTDISPLHNCCDICEISCKCEDETCPNSHISKTFESDDSAEEGMTREVTQMEQTLLRQRLLTLRSLISDGEQLIQAEIIHGLTDGAISQIIANCDKIFSADDVMKYCPVWSYELGVQISKIISEVFGDAEMYDLAVYSDTESD